MSLKALVTGGTGFVGSHVARALVEAGHQVRILHRKTSRLDLLEGLAYESALGDVLEADALHAACAGCDWVFHVAAVAHYWRADPQEMMAVNVDGTRLVLEAARAAGVKRVVFTSSAAAVGIRADGQPADESHPFNLPPERFPYGHSKWLAEQVVREAVAAGQDAVIVNPVIIMGPGDLNLISGSYILLVKRLQWTAPITSGGIAVVDVRDVAGWHLAAAEKGRPGERYLLGTANYKHREWLNHLADVLDVARPLVTLPDFTLPTIAALIGLLRRAGVPTPIDSNQTRLGSRNIFFDFSKAWAELGEPQVDMRRSIQDSYDWYLAHGYIKDGFVAKALRGVSRLWRKGRAG